MHSADRDPHKPAVIPEELRQFPHHVDAPQHWHKPLGGETARVACTGS